MGDMLVIHAYNPEKRAGEVLIDDFEVASTDYDATGWAGLALLEELANNLATYFGVTVTDRDTGGCEEESE
jgi:hypothetical protein